MKKIVFDDKYGLTKAVLEGRKTMTRRIVRNPKKVEINGHKYLQTEKLRFEVGEVVAVAQKYKDVYSDKDFGKEGQIDWEYINSFDMRNTAGFTNKIFVRADLMPHQIRITNVRVERLNDISDEDCFREGIFRFNLRHFHERYAYTARRKISDDATLVEYKPFDSPREAFASLIDKISGKGTWESNPWVFVYEFELVK